MQVRGSGMSTMASEQVREVGDIRAELGITQVQLARDAGLQKHVISRLEGGHPIGRNTAMRIFYALNRFRKARGFDELAFEQIKWVLTR